jgi:hypothetical protein
MSRPFRKRYFASDVPNALTSRKIFREFIAAENRWRTGSFFHEKCHTLFASLGSCLREGQHFSACRFVYGFLSSRIETDRRSIFAT